MPSLEEDQGKLASSIAQALAGSLSVSAAAESVVSSGDWLEDLHPRCYAVVSVALARSLVGVLQAQTAQPGCFFDAPGTRRIQILLSVAFKLGDVAKAREKSQDATISSLLRALPFEMMCDIVNVTPALEVGICTDVLQQAMADISSVEIQACKEAFSQACMALQALVVESEGAEQLGRISRWMLKHLPTSYKPAANIGFAINTAHPVRVGEVSENMTDSLGNSVDAERYKNFWSLQSSIYDADVLKDGNKWAQCVERIECVLAACAGPTQVEGEAALRTAGEGPIAYLSSPSLLNLQLQDVTFRRHQLVQVAMLLHFAVTSRENAALQACARMKPAQSKMAADAKQLLPRVLHEITGTGGDGHHFARFLERSLQVEVTDMHTKADMVKALTPAAKTAPAAAAKVEEGSKTPSQPSQGLKITKPPVTPKESSFMVGLDDTMRQVEKPWSLPDALDSKVRNMLDITDEDEDTTRDPLDGLDKDMTAQDALRAEFEVIAREASAPEDKRAEYGGIEKWRLLRHLSRLDLKHFSQTVLERDSSLLYAACEMFKGEDAAAEEYIRNLPKSKSEEKKQKKEKRRDKKDHGDRPHSGRQSDPGSSPHIPSKRTRTEMGEAGEAQEGTPKRAATSQLNTTPPSNSKAATGSGSVVAVEIDEPVTVEFSGKGKQRDTDKSSKAEKPAQKGPDGPGNRQESQTGDRSKADKPAEDALKTAGTKESDSSRKDQKEVRSGRDRDSERSARSARGNGDVQIVKGSISGGDASHSKHNGKDTPSDPKRASGAAADGGKPSGGGAAKSPGNADHRGAEKSQDTKASRKTSGAPSSSTKRPISATAEGTGGEKRGPPGSSSPIDVTGSKDVKDSGRQGGGSRHDSGKALTASQKRGPGIAGSEPSESKKLPSEAGRGGERVSSKRNASPSVEITDHANGSREGGGATATGSRGQKASSSVPGGAAGGSSGPSAPAGSSGGADTVSRPSSGKTLPGPPGQPPGPPSEMPGPPGQPPGPPVRAGPGAVENGASLNAPNTSDREGTRAPSAPPPIGRASGTRGAPKGSSGGGGANESRRGTSLDTKRGTRGGPSDPPAASSLPGPGVASGRRHTTSNDDFQDRKRKDPAPAPPQEQGGFLKRARIDRRPGDRGPR